VARLLRTALDDGYESAHIPEPTGRHSDPETNLEER